MEIPASWNSFNKRYFPRRSPRSLCGSSWFVAQSVDQALPSEVLSVVFGGSVSGGSVSVGSVSGGTVVVVGGAVVVVGGSVGVVGAVVVGAAVVGAVVVGAVVVAAGVFVPELLAPPNAITGIPT